MGPDIKIGHAFATSFPVNAWGCALYIVQAEALPGVD